MPRQSPAVSLLFSLTFLFGSASCLGAGTVGPAESPPGEPVFAYSRDPDAVLVRWRQVLGGIEDADPGSSVTVYGDGRVVVHHPRYRKGAGDYQGWLRPQEVEALVASLVDSGLPALDAPALVRAREEVATAPPGLSNRSDSTVTVIELHLERTTAGGEAGRIDREISWRGLGEDVKRAPGVGALRGLAAASEELRRLMDREDLERIE